ncbi:hypothetical protein H4R99_000140 [Coemansia sp. RSA 1722]|nr:hypothetical protein H4R99_000140 [Coemansia sp. RSA 1722]
MSDPRTFFQQQRGLGPGAAVEPTASEVKQGFAAQTSNPNPLPKLFQPLKIRGLTLKNRLVASPMCMYSSQDGFATDFHLVHIGQFAMRGLGLTIMEASGVSPEGRITPNCLGIWKDEHIDKLQQITQFVHANNGAIGIQLAHAGRKASTTAPWLMKTLGVNATVETGGWPENVVGPSAVAFDDRSWKPHELSIEEINRIQQDFAAAAARAHKAGFDVVEIHGAHGYLVHEFLSPISNQRTDQYGGSFDNRIRFVIETVCKIREVWPQEKPLFVRLSVTDWVVPSEDVPTGGWTEEESIELAKRLVNEGVDLVDCSTSGSSPKQSIPLSPGYQVRFATSIRNEVPGMLTGAVGLITDAVQANDILEQEKADLVFLGRALLREPNFVLDGALKLGVFPQYPHQYERGRNKTKLTFVKFINKQITRETVYKHVPKVVKSAMNHLLQACSAGVMHRDISSGNISVRDNDVYIIDWGYSKLVAKDHEKLRDRFETLATKWGFDLAAVVKKEKTRDPFTGTHEYMSIRVLSGKTERNIFDDMESLFYVIVHILQCIEKGKITDFLDTRCLPNNIAAHMKAAVMGNRKYYHKAAGIDTCPNDLLQMLDQMYDMIFMVDGSNVCSELIFSIPEMRKLDPRLLRSILGKETFNNTLAHHAPVACDNGIVPSCIAVVSAFSEPESTETPTTSKKRKSACDDDDQADKRVKKSGF